MLKIMREWSEFNEPSHDNRIHSQEILSGFKANIMAAIRDATIEERVIATDEVWIFQLQQHISKVLPVVGVYWEGELENLVLCSSVEDCHQVIGGMSAEDGQLIHSREYKVLGEELKEFKYTPDSFFDYRSLVLMADSSMERLSWCFTISMSQFAASGTSAETIATCGKKR